MSSCHVCGLWLMMIPHVASDHSNNDSKLLSGNFSSYKSSMTVQSYKLIERAAGNRGLSRSTVLGI